MLYSDTRMATRLTEFRLFYVFVELLIVCVSPSPLQVTRLDSLVGLAVRYNVTVRAEIHAED